MVVGAGSARCVLAGRLSEDPATRAAVGCGPVRQVALDPLAHRLWHDDVSFTYNLHVEIDPDPNLNSRRIYGSRGETLGGSSAINGLIYILGQREDYDHWAALGNTGWCYDDVLPYFINSKGNPRGTTAFRGGDGPLKVSDIAAKHELIEAFLDGAQQTGVPLHRRLQRRRAARRAMPSCAFR